MELREQKRRLRTELKSAERELSAEQKSRSDRAIVENLLAMPEYRRAGTLFCFAGAAGEIDTAPILRSALESGKRLCVPLCVGEGLMELRELRAPEQLSPGAYGLPEPPPQLPTVSPDEVDFAVVPCLSCGHDGRRLGRGGGYYDRFLEKYGGPAAVLCREALTREDLPLEPHDVRVAAVVTERGVFRSGL